MTLAGTDPISRDGGLTELQNEANIAGAVNDRLTC